MATRQVTVIDFRSDTMSLPTRGMRDAIFNAEVGDDVFHEDPSVNAIEIKAAAMFEKEAALYFPSGTMCNLAAILAHCEKRASEIIVGSHAHIIQFEQTGAAQLGGVNIRTVENKADGTFSIDELKSKVRSDDIHYPRTRMICVENTHNILGGLVVPLEWIDELAKYAKSIDVPLHMDGARIFNAAIKLNVPVSRITKDFASVSVCLSKSLGAPIGSILVGSKEFINLARRIRKVVGGGCRQIGFMAAAGLYALENMVDRLKDDHENCQKIGNAIRELKNPYVTVQKSDDIHTNILIINFDTSKIKPATFAEKLQTIETNDDSVVVKILPLGETFARIVVCCNQSDVDIEKAIQKIQRTIALFS